MDRNYTASEILVKGTPTHELSQELKETSQPPK